eukprot:gene19750-119_t
MMHVTPMNLIDHIRRALIAHNRHQILHRSVLKWNRENRFFQCHKCTHQWHSKKAAHHCPKCAILKPNTKTLDAFPNLAQDWHPTKNIMAPHQTSTLAMTKACWICHKCNFEWSATLYDRTQKGTGCPKCRRGRGSKGVVQDYPDMMRAWHWELNGDFDPSKLAAFSNKKVHWKCGQCDTVYQRLVGDQQLRHHCTRCTKRSKQPAVSTSVDLMCDWDPSNTLDPNETSLGSQHKVGWICSKCRFKWETRVFGRNKGSGCPVCARGGILPREMLSTNALLMAEIHPTQNDGIDPSAISLGSAKKIVWQCSKCQHIWKMTVHSRSRQQGGKCPCCRYRPLISQYPLLVQEWHPTKNGDNKPNMFHLGSSFRRTMSFPTTWVRYWNDEIRRYASGYHLYRLCGSALSALSNGRLRFISGHGKVQDVPFAILVRTPPDIMCCFESYVRLYEDSTGNRSTVSWENFHMLKQTSDTEQ